MLAALRDVGLFYLKNHPVQASLFEEARQECDAFFSLPDVDKAEIDIANVPSFLGYTKVSDSVHLQVFIAQSVHSPFSSGQR